MRFVNLKYDIDAINQLGCNCKVILTIVVLRVIWGLYLMHLFRGGCNAFKKPILCCIIYCQFATKISRNSYI